ncbi:MAG TPA: hypothetical protein VLR94_09010 [Acidobacteriota bacterium]|nr:hypothetical protein [Acidobacteriota bacterium]
MEATRSNALSRQGDNNLAAMVQREQLAGKTQKSSGIPKEELNELAAALNSKGPAADGVKEGLLSAYVGNKPGQHQKIARCLQQLAASGSNEHSQAYQAMKKEMRELTAFDPSGQTQPLARSFYKEVANLKGPGSERVKADMAAAIQDNIEKAKSEPAGGKGTRAYAGIYTEELGKMLNSDAPGIFNTMEKDLGLRKEIPRMMDNLLNHKEGQKAIGQMVAGMAATTAKSLMQSAEGNRDAAQRLGLFMGHVERGIENNTKTREEAIEKGANLLKFGLQAAERLSPGEAGEGFKKVQEGIEWLKKHDVAKVEDAKHEVESKMYDLVDSTFMAVADPYGNLSAGNGDPGKVQKFRDAERVYDEEYLQRRNDALIRESLR